MTGLLLDPELHARLLAVLRAENNPTPESLQPGLIDSEMDALTARLGLRLPDEARVWWGTNDGAPPGTFNQILATGWPYLPLEEAVEFTLEMREAYAVPIGDADEPLWPSSWLTLTYSGRSVLAIDCSVPGPAAPIHDLHMEDTEIDPLPAVPSLGTAVLWAEGSN